MSLSAHTCIYICVCIASLIPRVPLLIELQDIFTKAIFCKTQFLKFLSFKFTTPTNQLVFYLFNNFIPSRFFRFCFVTVELLNKIKNTVTKQKRRKTRVSKFSTLRNLTLIIVHVIVCTRANLSYNNFDDPSAITIYKLKGL